MAATSRAAVSGSFNTDKLMTVPEVRREPESEKSSAGKRTGVAVKSPLMIGDYG